MKYINIIKNVLIILFFSFLLPLSSSAYYSFPTKIDTLDERINIQVVLNTVMSPSPNLTVDGVLGRKSIQAIQSFQESRGLVPDGKVGPITRTALEQAQGVTTTTTSSSNTSNTSSSTTTTGCIPGGLFNTQTGKPCTTTTSSENGCTSSTKYSPITGQYCGNTTTVEVAEGSTSNTAKSISNANTTSTVKRSSGGGGGSTSTTTNNTSNTNTPVIITKIINVSSSSNDGHIDRNTLDGNFTDESRWSADGDGQYITYELNQTSTVSYLRIAFYSTSQRYFDIQYSTNGTTWTNATSRLTSAVNKANQYQTFSFTSVQAKYIRILGHGSSAPSLWNSIVEMDINGFAVDIPAQTTPTCSGLSTQSCTISNGTGTQSRTCTNGTWSSYNSCTLSSCNSGYQKSGNSCVVIPTTCTPESSSVTCSDKCGTQTNNCGTSVSCTACSTPTTPSNGDHPNMFLNQQEINSIKSKITSHQSPWESAYTKLISSANSELSKSYYSVTKNGGSPNKSVYSGRGPYAWLCHENPCGVSCTGANTANSWVICDGQTNPNVDREDYKEAIRAGNAIRNLALAYQFTGDTKYADKAIYFINHWTVDSSTMMSPYYPGFQSKIELSITMPALFYGADLLLNYSGWNNSDKLAFLEWTKDFGESAMSWTETNNFENWRNVVLFSIAALNDDSSMLDYAVNNYKRIIPSQINTSGFMTKEINRADSLDYSSYAMNAMVQGAEIAKHQGVDLYNYKDTRGIGLKNALDTHATYLASPSKWTYSQVNTYSGANASIYELAYSFINNASYLSVINKWGRPMTETRTMGPVTLTHSRGSHDE